MFGHGLSLNPASFKYNWRGAWSPNTIYDYRDVVKHRGRTYYCNTDGLRKNQIQGYVEEPGKRGTAWTVHTMTQVNRGGWGPHKQYEVGDVVMYKGDWYLCKTAGYGIHPVYENGALTNKWTKVLTSPQLSNPSKFIPLGANENPLGWTRYNGGGNGFGMGWGAPGGEGAWLVDWDGMPKWFGRTMTHSQQYFKHLNIGADEEFRTGWNPAFQFIDFKFNDKFPITDSKIECVQMITGNGQHKFLFNNGEVYSWGINTGRSIGWSENTETAYTPQRTGRDYQNGSWDEDITGTFRDAFIIKLVGGSSVGAQGQIAGTTAALDSEGYVWVWGDSNRGALGIGDGGQTGNDLDRGIPVQLPKSMFGGDSIVDIYGCNYVVSTAYQTYYAITENDIVYAWGDNQYGQAGSGGGQGLYVKRPQPVFDGNKYGGIKRVSPHSGQYCFCIILCNDGSLHHTGYGASVNAVYNEHQGFNSYGFIDLRQHLYEAYKGQSKALSDHIDVYTGVQDIWVDNQGYGTAAGHTGGFVFKDSDGHLRKGGSRNGTVYPVLREINGYDTTSAKYLAVTEEYLPSILDTTSLNGKVEWVLMTGTDYNDNKAGQLFVMDEEGRAKVSINSGGANGYEGAGWAGASFGSTTDADYAMSTLDKTMYIDEGELDYRGMVSHRGSWRTNRVVHAVGAAHYAGDYTAHVTISEDGTAGAFGDVDSVTHSYLENRSNYGTVAQATNQPTYGRALFV